MFSRVPKRGPFKSDFREASEDILVHRQILIIYCYADDQNPFYAVTYMSKV